VTPVKQNVLFASDGIGNGNCFGACMASLLDLPLWMVPPFEQMFGRSDNWRSRVDDWLGRLFKLRLADTEGHCWNLLPEFYIANGRSPRGVAHSTIYRAGRLVHDPHFSNAGIEAVEWCWHLAPQPVEKAG
jgi:hypothetical protein